MHPTLHLIAELRAVRIALYDAREQEVDAETIAALEIDEANVLEALFDGGEVQHERMSFRLPVLRPTILPLDATWRAVQVQFERLSGAPVEDEDARITRPDAFAILSQRNFGGEWLEWRPWRTASHHVLADEDGATIAYAREAAPFTNSDPAAWAMNPTPRAVRDIPLTTGQALTVRPGDRIVDTDGNVSTVTGVDVGWNGDDPPTVRASIEQSAAPPTLTGWDLGRWRQFLDADGRAAADRIAERMDQVVDVATWRDVAGRRDVVEVRFRDGAVVAFGIPDAARLAAPQPQPRFAVSLDFVEGMSNAAWWRRANAVTEAALADIRSTAERLAGDGDQVVFGGPAVWDAISGTPGIDPT